MRRVKVGQPATQFRVEQGGVGQGDEVRRLAAIADERGEETERTAGALEAALGLANPYQRDVEQFRRERKTLAKLIGVVGRNINAEATPGVQVTVNDRVNLG